MVRDLLAEIPLQKTTKASKHQANLTIDYLLSLKAQGRLIAHRPTGYNVLNSFYKPIHKFRLWEICMKKVFKIHRKVHKFVGLF